MFHTSNVCLCSLPHMYTAFHTSAYCVISHRSVYDILSSVLLYYYVFLLLNRLLFVGCICWMSVVTGNVLLILFWKITPLAFYDKGWTSELTFTWHESIIHLSDWRQHDWVPFPRALERRTGDVWDRRWWLLIRPQGQSIIFDKAKGVCISPDRKLSATQKSTVIILSVTHCRHPGHLCFCFLNFFLLI